MTTTLNQIADNELLFKTSKLVKKEKEFTFLVLKYLVEVDRRKLFADLGFSSLFQYCVQHLHYTENEALCRIQSMRLMRESVLIEKKIEDGSLSLTNASKIEQHIKKENKKGKKVDKQEKENLVMELLNVPTRKAEEILQEKRGEIRPELDGKMIKLSARVLEKLKKIKEIEGDYSEEELIEILIERRLREEKHTAKRETTKETTNTRQLPIKVREEVIKRASHQCEFITADGKNRCTEKRALEFEHVKAFTLGGLGDIKNIKLFCRAHNFRAGVRVFGAKRMNLYHSYSTACFLFNNLSKPLK